MVQATDAYITRLSTAGSCRNDCGSFSSILQTAHYHSILSTLVITPACLAAHRTRDASVNFNINGINYIRVRQLCYAGYSVLLPSLISLFSAPNLLSRQILIHVRWWPKFIKLGQKFGTLSLKNGSSKNIKIWGKFREWIVNISERNTTLSNGKWCSNCDICCVCVRLGIFQPNFTCLLCVPIYAWLRIFIQLSATLTKLCVIKREHPVHIMCAKCPPSAKTHACIFWHISETVRNF